MSFVAILFWIILILSVLGIWAPAGYERPRAIVMLVLIALLGWAVFGNPFDEGSQPQRSSQVR